MLVEATANAGKSLLLLCGIVLIFSGACGVCDAFGIFQLLEQITISCGITVPTKVLWESVFEVTYAVQLALPFAIKIPMLTGLLAFGGLCVMMQVRVAAGEIFSVKRFFCLSYFYSDSFCRNLSFGDVAISLGRGYYHLSIDDTAHDTGGESIRNFSSVYAGNDDGIIVARSVEKIKNDSFVILRNYHKKEKDFPIFFAVFPASCLSL